MTYYLIVLDGDHTSTFPSSYLLNAETILRVSASEARALKRSDLSRHILAEACWSGNTSDKDLGKYYTYFLSQES